jgi:hypothetical protein
MDKSRSQERLGQEDALRFASSYGLRTRSRSAINRSHCNQSQRAKRTLQIAGAHARAIRRSFLVRLTKGGEHLPNASRSFASSLTTNLR